MIVNFIYSALILFVAFVVVVAILLFGVKFSKDGGEVDADPSWKDVILQVLRGYPFWIWIIAFLASQPSIFHILKTWKLVIWAPYEWIPDLSCFIAFITVVFYLVLINITDDNGRIKIFSKSKWMCQKNSSCISGGVSRLMYYFILNQLF